MAKNVPLINHLKDPPTFSSRVKLLLFYFVFVVIGSKPDRDDIHLLLEYSKGQAWGGYVSPKANRYFL